MHVLDEEARKRDDEARNFRLALTQVLNRALVDSGLTMAHIGEVDGRLRSLQALHPWALGSTRLKVRETEYVKEPLEVVKRLTCRKPESIPSIIRTYYPILNPHQ